MAIFEVYSYILFCFKLPTYLPSDGISARSGSRGRIRRVRTSYHMAVYVNIE